MSTSLIQRFSLNKDSIMSGFWTTVEWVLFICVSSAISTNLLINWVNWYANIAVGVGIFIGNVLLITLTVVSSLKFFDPILKAETIFQKAKGAVIISMVSGIVQLVAIGIYVISGIFHSISIEIVIINSLLSGIIFVGFVWEKRRLFVFTLILWTAGSLVVPKSEYQAFEKETGTAITMAFVPVGWERFSDRFIVFPKIRGQVVATVVVPKHTVNAWHKPNEIESNEEVYRATIDFFVSAKNLPEYYKVASSLPATISATSASRNQGNINASLQNAFAEVLGIPPDRKSVV